MAPDDEDYEAVAIWQRALVHGHGQVWEDCRSITVRRRGHTLCRFFEPYVWVAFGGARDQQGPDGWWRLYCDPMSAKQKKRALAPGRGIPNTAGNYVRN